MNSLSFLFLNNKYIKEFYIILSMKNIQKIDKTFFSKERSYAQNVGIYYNQNGFSHVTNKISDIGTYNPDKYVLGNVTKPNTKTFIDYNNKIKKHKSNNTKININNIKNNKETYAYVSNIMVPIIEAEVKPITEILKENKNNVINSRNIVINSKEFKELHKDEKAINNKEVKKVKGKLSVNLFANVFEHKEQICKYTYTSSISVDWYKYIDKIYFLHSKYNNKRTIDNLHTVGINEYNSVFYKTELTFDKCKYYKSISFIESIEDAYKNNINNILIIKDDIKFIDNKNIIETFLYNSFSNDISILNPNDIAYDCIILRKHAIEYIHNLNINVNEDNWHYNFIEKLKNNLKIYKPIYDICLHLIDYVIPYVDNNDIEWQNIHNQYKIKETGEINTVNRYRSFDNLQYIFRGIEKYCKFIDNIYLIVMQETQIPKWINRQNVKIIYHKDFIPESKLPCFSSCLIETYMTNIQDLSEYFLYGNDDMFVINNTNRIYWFTNGIPNNNMVSFYASTDFFSINCKRTWLQATNEFNKNSRMYRTKHNINGILRSTGLHLHELYETEIDKSTSRFRGNNDFNQYLYIDYLFALNNYKFNTLKKCHYYSIKNKNSLIQLETMSQYICICLNDCILNDIDFNYIKENINNRLNNILPNKSIYEMIKPYTGKVLLCCIGKMENNYIREFVEYYKTIGFDNICLYDNNDIDGEHFEDVIGDYINSGFVILKDWRGKELAQIPSYTDCYNTYKDKYDWIAYFDIDEFLDLDCNNIKEFLSQDMYNDRGINTIRICWRQFTDSDILNVEDNNYSIKRFTEYLPLTTKYTASTKIIIKTVLDNIEFNSPHGILYNSKYADKIIAVNTEGQLCRNSIFLGNNEITWENARLNHYRFKTIEEYVMNKMVRRWPTSYLNGGKNGLNLNMFFRFNKKTQEKENFANYLLDKYNIERNE